MQPTASLTSTRRASSLTSARTSSPERACWDLPPARRRSTTGWTKNPGVIALPIAYVNDPAVIASMDNFVSLNSCVSVDLYGQINSESAGLRHISGTGGQVDFLTGASMSKGGKSFICVASSRVGKDGGRTSNIVPHFNGEIITSPRSQAYYIATEQGVVNLAGRSSWERAEMLVSIAHPDFRDELIKPPKSSASGAAPTRDNNPPGGPGWEAGRSERACVRSGRAHLLSNGYAPVSSRTPCSLRSTACSASSAGMSAG